MSDVMHHSRATWLGVSAIATWAVMPLLMAHLRGLPPFQVTGLAFMIGVAAVMGWWLARREPVLSYARMPGRIWAAGIGGVFGFHFFYFLSFQMIAPVESFLVMESWPLVTMLLSVPVLGRRLHGYQLAGALLGFAGIISIAQVGGAREWTGQAVAGYGFSLIAACCWAMYSVLATRWKAEMKHGYVGMFCLASGVLCLLVSLLWETWVAPDAFQWAMLLLLGVGPMGVSFFAWHEGMRRGNVPLLLLLSFGVPVAGSGLLILAGFAESSPGVGAAIALVTVGSLVGSGVWRRFINNK